MTKRAKAVKRTQTKSAWEIIHPCTPGEHFGDPGVRRLAVPGGWLYQVQRAEDELQIDGEDTWGFAWQPPVFVPNAG